MASPNKPNVKNKITLVMIFLLVVLLFVGLAVRLGYHMIVKAEDYSEMAIRQQTSDNVVTAVRGKILDRNGNEFAVSTNSYTVWVRPASVKGNGKTEAEKQYNIQQEAQALADILKLDYDSVYASITADSALRKVAKYVDLDTANVLRSMGLTGIELTEEPSRNYPLGTFACHVIGNTNDDNVGISGLELYYENLLEGINGRWITNKDAKKNALPFGTDKYYGAVDGYTLVTTVDQNIQFIVEQKLASCQLTTQAARVMCIVMDPSTAEILAMAQTPAYDLNDPRAPITPEDAEMMEMMTSEEKVAYWNRLWRNFCVSDTYEPGSTFKLITTSIALDNGVTNQTETFYCSPRTVADYTLKCWYSPRSHGQENLAQAVQNSCNPVMIDLAQRLGLTKYYAGLDAFCLTEKTGVDFPGEGSNILQNRRTAGPVGLATMSYGQGIAVTPISLITAISSIANGGRLMQPHFLKAVYDADGNLIREVEPTIKSRPISEQTAKEVLEIMESVVSEGGGGTAKVPGYRIGGKTGTANKPEKGGYSDTDVYASFIGVAPIDDPKIAILVIVDTPKGVLYGSQTAAPCAREIMADIFRYMNIQPEYSEEELAAKQAKMVEVPDLTDRSVENAVGILGGKGLGYSLSPEIETSQELIIIDQYPKPGESVSRGTKVTLYYEIVQGEGEVVDGEDVPYDGADLTD